MSINKTNTNTNPAMSFNSQNGAGQSTNEQSSQGGFANMIGQVVAMRSNGSNSQNGQTTTSNNNSKSQNLKARLNQLNAQISQAQQSANDAQGVYDRVSQPGWGPEFQTQEAVRDKNNANQKLAELQAEREQVTADLQQAEQEESLYRAIGLNQAPIT